MSKNSQRVYLQIFSILFLLSFNSRLNAQSIGGIVNTYTAVTNMTANSVTVSSAVGFAVGDRVLLIQMKGATINQTNTASFGQVVALGSAGNFEFTNIASISGNTITFVSNLCKPFVVSGKIQLIRVPVYNQATINAVVTASPWNGSTGGVVAIEATTSLTFNNVIDVSGKGFIGGAVTTGWFMCNDPNYASSGANAGKKGEGIALAPLNLDGNRAPLANGGGGANSGNPGAGGGSNGGAGGRGGNQFSGSCPVNTAFGMGGYAMAYGAFRAYLGGGGGGGYKDNGLNATAGSNGGGIVFIVTPTVIGNNQQIIASGANVIGNTDSEGAGGGGAGGCVYLLTQNINSNLTIDIKGGNGGNIFNTLWASACHGPGGGGGAGAIVFQQAALPANVTPVLTGGNPGSVLHTGPACAGSSFGAQAGAPGILVYNYAPPTPGTPPNLGPDTLICAGTALTLQPDAAYTAYTWSNGANTSSITINAAGTYWLDVPSGCGLTRDSIVVSVQQPVLDLGPDLSHCLGDSSLLQPTGSTGTYLWSTGATTPTISVQNAGSYVLNVLDNLGCSAQDLINVSVLQPDTSYVSMTICADSILSFNGLSINSPGVYTVHLNNQNGCDSMVVLTLTEWNLPVVVVADTFVCANTCVTLTPTGALNYFWDIAQNANGSITVCPGQTTNYMVYGTDANGCASAPVQATVQIDPIPVPDFYINPDQVEIDNPSIVIYNVTAGNLNHQWNVNGTIFENANSSFNFQLPFQEGTYTVQLVSSTDLGCTDSLTLTATVMNNIAVYIPNTFTPDGQAFNNTFFPVFSTGFTPKNYSLTIFNRWGEEIFVSQDPLAYWDGAMADGTDCPDGVYNYLLEYQEINKGEVKQILGFVRLIK
ncbi:MAG: gliding motility-associated C-terminal domain-containing protein [Crocinitomicaceae bacterium]|nr:gliding motility-associated C-terminal domain-containing protein [Crocinitomicaceae bacterium]MDP4723579.1 gliding motility-associated C-terminal domain-containing protein [Crocinitomicaceae bacterium]MDP4738849.1 gliding motility-associated C-terminal domain-containing protein [Crocinitomicaceae bacterium]MDP4799043.1 gliding motility-associated C-terminal domain-containing protein [Crocinitomicaceae bacterium]MDP4867513.1 gliding motility-associated C-terminal domain-containing protein [Cr